jgi:hypothetical protein
MDNNFYVISDSVARIDVLENDKRKLISNQNQRQVLKTT